MTTVRDLLADDALPGLPALLAADADTRLLAHRPGRRATFAVTDGSGTRVVKLFSRNEFGAALTVTRASARHRCAAPALLAVDAARCRLELEHVPGVPLTPADRLDAAARTAGDDVLYLCGSAANEGDVWTRFTSVVALTVDDQTLRERLAGRSGNNFGKAARELQLALTWNRTYAGDMTRAGALVLDATRPVEDVVDELLEGTTAPVA